MTVRKLILNNFTVFDRLDIDFSAGINVFIGENGTGKTHIMKALYSACQAAKTTVSFSNKIAKVFKPDNLAINRLVKKPGGNKDAEIKVFSDTSNISMNFSTKTKKWEGVVKGEEKWEKQMEDLTSTFIPAKEILSNAWNFEAAYDKNNIDFDDTYLDIVTTSKVDISQEPDNPSKKKYLSILKKSANGKVVVENEKFYLKSGTQSKIEFQLIAEGIRKIALLWQLINNGTLEKGSILFWDEPEANINPVHIPILVEMLLELQRNGVQVFISTHDYILSKYIEVKKLEDDQIAFYSLYKENDTVKCEVAESFSDLSHNAISDSFNKLLDEVYFKKYEVKDE